MRTHSTYEFECVCGRKLVVPCPTGTCHHCERQYELHWGGRAPGEPGPCLRPQATSADRRPA